MSELKICESCGMPMEDASQHGGGDIKIPIAYIAPLLTANSKVGEKSGKAWSHSTCLKEKQGKKQKNLLTST